MRRITLVLVSLILLSGCSVSPENEKDKPLDDELQSEAGNSTSATRIASGLEIPPVPENSDHGYLLDDNRIPIIKTCQEWQEFWMGGGPAISFAIADEYSTLFEIEVSTQIYLKNQHLDPAGIGVICFDPKSDLKLDSLPIGVNDRSRDLPLEKCQLKGSGAGVAFPRPSGFLPAFETIRAVMLFVNFPGFTLTEDIQAEAQDYFGEFQEYMKIQSRGQQEWTLHVPDQVFYIDRDPRKYKADFTDPDFGSPRFDLYFQDAVSSADSIVDFSNYDVVYVVPPKQIGSTISYGPSFPNLSSGSIVSNEGSISAGAVAGNNSRLGRNSKPWQWLAHETGHLYGLSHPLNEKGNIDEFGREISPDKRPEFWDLMTWLESPSPDLWGWSRFWIGWLDDHVYCLESSIATEAFDLHISFADQPRIQDSVELAIIRVDNSTAIALESRRPSKFPFDGKQAKLLAYKVNTNRGDLEGQFEIIPANESRYQGWLDGSMSVGTSIQIDGLTITFVGQSENGALVRIEP